MHMDVKELRLSDSFLGEMPENSMELVVKIIDVRYNKDKVNEVLARSEKLRGYSLLLNYVNEYRRGGESLQNAVELSIKRCIDEGILKGFLTRYGLEVKGMLLDDITIEEFAEIRATEKWEKGRIAGRAETLERMNRLIQILISEDRVDDLEKASKDEAFQEKLFAEFGI